MMMVDLATNDLSAKKAGSIRNANREEDYLRTRQPAV